ncbi:biotin--[acetyl-CoA-carboxylase] ligase [Bacillus sp. FJAT-49732]|uniref:Bifunctional ligase/repressor BirA n=1 Tax=Lederbergia citrisecunda TaxID=2833583 RepID=A0A942TJZ3_9BACI|nr:biotin--[acetyl-CoA-carboxylase] ligase [Lederbergia citrisecunda]MBS4199485.1 biotin--[acetyl-CoA-carboxylase] ligase [Lederbergia citrisecunda]
MSSSVKKQLYEALANADGEYLSGQALADIIGCSRTAIWKHIEELRKSGFELEAVRKKGYRLISKPDKLSDHEILIGLETKTIGRHVHYYESVESTQLIAHKVAREEAPEGTLVIAGEQTGGKGRMARPWHSSKQQGIWMSLIIRPKLPPEKAPQFTLITAIACARAIEEVTGLETNIKWPNDILYKGKKLTGILTELQGEADKVNFLVIGIGMNVNQKKEDFPEHVKEIASSLEIEAGHKVSKIEMIQKILKYFEKYYELYMEKGFAPLKILWESYAAGIGKPIIARTITGEISGIALGISNEGILKVEDDEGTIHHIYSADIEFPT